MNKSQGVIWPQRKRTIDQRLPTPGLGGMESIEWCLACRPCSRWRELRIPPVQAGRGRAGGSSPPAPGSEKQQLRVAPGFPSLEVWGRWG